MRDRLAAAPVVNVGAAMPAPNDSEKKAMVHRTVAVLSVSVGEIVMSGAVHVALRRGYDRERELAFDLRGTAEPGSCLGNPRGGA